MSADTRTSCEDHDVAGHCTQACVDLQNALNPYIPDDFPYDPTGCHRPKPMPEYEPRLDTERWAVVWVAVHPEDCECWATDCPRRVAEESQ